MHLDIAQRAGGVARLMGDAIRVAAEGDERNVTVVDPSSWVAVESATDALLLAQLFVLGFEVRCSALAS